MLEYSALSQVPEDRRSITYVSLGRKPDGTVDPQNLYFEGEKGIFQTTWTTRRRATPPVLAYPDIGQIFTISGPHDGYKVTQGKVTQGTVVIRGADTMSITHFKDSGRTQKLTADIASGFNLRITIGVWPLVGKPQAKP